jgi:hypothetical protein
MNFDLAFFVIVKKTQCYPSVFSINTFAAIPYFRILLDKAVQTRYRQPNKFAAG